MDILLIDDDSDIRNQLKWHLKKEYNVVEASDRDEAKDILLKKDSIRLIILDIFLPPDIGTPRSGFNLLKFLRKNYSEIPVIVITGNEKRELALEAIEKGAVDFFQKPIDLAELKIVIKRVIYRTELEKEIIYLKEELSKQHDFSNIIYSSEKMENIIHTVKQILEIDLPVFIEGESGTGKELIARAIHYNSKNRVNRFVPINCSAIPSNLLESELFGYRKGAFTGAYRDHTGKIELADKGTLFLDEIGDMPLEMQAKLLRVLEDGIVTRIGSNKPKKIKFRLITATNKNLEAMIEEGRFREDLFYRIKVINLKLPSLRERREDIPLLVYHFIKLYNKKNNGNIKGVSKNLMNRLTRYNYKGNVRELENIIYTGCALCHGDVLTEENIALPEIPYSDIFSRDAIKGKTFKEKVSNFEKMLLKKAIEESNGVYIKAARKLGLDKYKMKYLVKKYGIRK